MGTQKGIFGRLAALVMARPAVSASAIVACMLVSIALALQLNVSTNILEMLPPGDPTTEAIMELNREEKGANLLVIGVHGEDPEALHAFMVELTEELTRVEGVDYALYQLEQDFAWDTCQLPVNVLDYHYRSFQRQMLPQLVDRGIGVIGMKSLGGDAQLITGAGLTAEQCRRYALSLPISVLVCGMESEENLEQDLAVARDFEAYDEAEMARLREQVMPVAKDGRFEWFKSTQFYDSQTHRDQHGFPPIGSVGQPPADKETS